MKKLLIALIAGAFALSACSSNDAPAAKHHHKHKHSASAVSGK